MISLDPRLRSAALATAPFGVVIVIALVLLPLSPAYDLNVFLRAGDAILRGRDFYPRVGSPAVYSGSSFVYPALAVWPFVPLAALRRSRRQRSSSLSALSPSSRSHG